MSIDIGDIRRDNESSDLLNVYRGEDLIAEIFTEVYYASSKGYFIIVLERSIPIEKTGESVYSLQIQGIT